MDNDELRDKETALRREASALRTEVDILKEGVRLQTMLHRNSCSSAKITTDFRRTTTRCVMNWLRR
jgi:hypothetical protein